MPTFPLGELDGVDLADLGTSNPRLVGRLISAAENYPDKYPEVFEEIRRRAAESGAPVVGVTGTGGSGKSSLVDEVVRRYLAEYQDRTIAVVSVDPSRRRSGGALLGDRIRMNSIHHPRAYMRSLATRQPNLALSPHVQTAVDVVRAAGYDLVILETSGIGQSDTEIVDHCDLSVYVMTPEYGAATQLEKTDMLDYADLVAINKADKQGALDALRDVRKQVRRNRVQFDGDDADLPVYLTVASDFNDPATNLFYRALTDACPPRPGLSFPVGLNLPVDEADKQHVVPPARTRYLAEIVESIRRYDAWVDEQSDAAEDLYRLEGAKSVLASLDGAEPQQVTPKRIEEAVAAAEERLDPECRKLLERWDGLVAEYAGEDFVYLVRGRQIEVPLYHTTLSGTRVAKVATPRYRGWGDRLRWMLQENIPGEFPVHRRRVSLQADRGGPDPDVRR